MHSVTVTPNVIVQSLNDTELHCVGTEVREWHRTGKTQGAHLAQLAQRLVTQSNMQEDGVTQVVEALVLNEICRRWLLMTAP